MAMNLPSPGGYLSPLANIFPALGPVINAWGNAYNDQANLAQDQLRTRTIGGLANAGLSDSPTGQSILGNALGRQSGQFMAGYTGQLMGLIPQLGQFGQHQGDLDWQAQQAALSFQRQKELQNLGLQNQLSLARQMGPIDAANYTLGVNTQRGLFPNNGSAQGIAGAGMGAGMPSGYGMQGLRPSNTAFQYDPKTNYGPGQVNPVSGAPAMQPNQFPGTTAAGMPGGVDYKPQVAN